MYRPQRFFWHESRFVHGLFEWSTERERERSGEYVGCGRHTKCRSLMTSSVARAARVSSTVMLQQDTGTSSSTTCGFACCLKIFLHNIWIHCSYDCELQNVWYSHCTKSTTELCMSLEEQPSLLYNCEVKELARTVLPPVVTILSTYKAVLRIFLCRF